MRSLLPASALVLLVLTTSLAPAVEWPSRYTPPAERGRELYDRLCVSCHGPQAAGDGKAAAALVVKVPDFKAGFGDRDRDELIRAVLKGKGAMPGFENALKDIKAWSGDPKEFARAVVDHMDRVGREQPAPPPEAPPKGEDDAEGDAP